MSRRLYIYIKLLLPFILVLTMSSCGSKTPEMTEKEITEGLSKSISSTFSFDKISEVSYEQISTNEEEFGILKQKFQSEVPYASYKCTATLENLDMIAKVSYRIVCAYNNNTWEVVGFSEWDKSQWVYKAKKYPSERDIMRDISKYKFGSFDVGYVGNEKNSSVSIIKSVFDETVNRETQDIKLVIKTKFGHYDINAQIIYYFLNGEWTVGDFKYDDISDWDFVYEDGCELDILSNTQVFKRMTDKNNFLTYSTNADYIDDYKIEYQYMDATEDAISAVYEFTALYPFGSVAYTVRASYQWLDYEWSDCAVSVSLSASDFSSFQNCVLRAGTNSLFITDSHPITSEELDSYKENYNFDSSSSMFTYSLNYEGNQYIIKTCLTVPLRDNNWNAIIISVEKVDDTAEDITVSKVSLLTDTGSVMINDDIFGNVV